MVHQHVVFTVVLWEEFDYGQSGSSYNVADNGVRCVQVDGGGRPRPRY